MGTSGAPAPLRILHVTPFHAHPGFGGIARASAGLAREQARRGHGVTVVTTRRDGEPPDAVEHGVRVVRLAHAGPRLFPLARGLRALLARELPRTDVVHVHGVRHGLALPVPAACRCAGKRYVLQPHGTAPHHGQRRLAKALVDTLGATRVLRDAALRLAVSDAEARQLGAGAVVVGNGIDAPARPRPPRRPGPPRLLFVGNDAPQKRLPLALALVEQLPGVELLLAGPVSDPGRPRVRRLGVLDDAALWDAMQDADVLVQPGVHEAFGLAAFEAAVLGTAAVVADGHGAGDWMRRAGGSVVAADDAAALLAGVERLLADPAGARAEAARVAAHVEQELRWRHVAERVEAAYAPVTR